MVKSSTALTDVDLKLLRVFCSIVECRGFSQAQVELNLSRSTISTHMANLETRLGFRLCQRGRAGFSLTERGRAVYESSRGLLSSIEGYHSQITQLREQIVGEITIGVVDNIITSPDCHLGRAIKQAYSAASDLRIVLRVAPPNQVEEQLIRGHVQMAITPRFVMRKHISQVDLFIESQQLFCGRDHSLFPLDETDITAETIARQDYVRRGYISALTPYSAIFKRPAIAVSYQMEGLAHFILSGCCLGFLPAHYAQSWIDRGDMRVLLSEELRFDVPVCVARDESAEHSLAEKHVYDTLVNLHLAL